MDYGLKTERLNGYQSTVDHRDQYVVGEVRADGTLMLLYQLSPPCIRPIDSPSLGRLGGFFVFCSNPTPGNQYLNNLAEIWRHSSQNHETTLKLYSLHDLGLVEKS